MIPRIVLAFALLAGAANAAPVPKEVKQRPDVERMRGVWKEVSGTRWFFDGDKLYAGGQDTTVNKGIEYDIPLRPNLVPPEFDLVVKGTIQYRGIYKFVDGELRIAYSNTPTRPTDIEQTNGAFRHILKRDGEEKK